MQRETMVVQPNNITQAEYKLTTHQKHVLLMAMGIINTTAVITEKDAISIDIRKMHELRKSKSRIDRYVKSVKKDVEKLACQTLKIPLADGSRKNIPWLAQEIQNPHDEKSEIITIYLNQFIAKLFSQIDGKYTQYLLKNAILLDTTYAIRIYEFCMQYKPAYKDVPPITLDNLRTLLGIEEKYKTTKRLFADVINPAIAEINKQTDIKIKMLSHIKEGKTIKAIRLVYEFKTKKQEQIYKAKEQNNAVKNIVKRKAPEVRRTRGNTASQMVKKHLAKHNPAIKY